MYSSWKAYPENAGKAKVEETKEKSIEEQLKELKELKDLKRRVTVLERKLDLLRGELAVVRVVAYRT